jgi:transcriptional regulator with XRE-family HTH domain
MEATHPIKLYREAQRLTQNDLAERLGVARTTVARWETGERNIDDELLPKVSELTGITKAILRPDLARMLAQTEAAE